MISGEALGKLLEGVFEKYLVIGIGGGETTLFMSKDGFPTPAEVLGNLEIAKHIVVGGIGNSKPPVQAPKDSGVVLDEGKV